MSDIILTETNDTALVAKALSHLPEHKEMLHVIAESQPEIHRATSLFCKTQSQFMDNMLTVSHHTPLRNLRQILSEMNKTREAIKESYFKLQRKEIEYKLKLRDMEVEKDELKQQLLQIDCDEISANIESSRNYLSGAIRKLTNYTAQYNSIVKQHNLENFNELDFEREEEKYHIMRAFDQAVCAARSRNTIIDEGNTIYLTQIGINVSGAQHEVTTYLNLESSLLREGKEPTHKMFLAFLERMASKYAGCSKAYAEQKGMTGKITELAALTSGDTRLLGAKNAL